MSIILNTGHVAGQDIEKVAKKTSMAYLQGMAWSFAYYVHGSLPVPLTKSAEASLATLAGKGKGTCQGSMSIILNTGHVAGQDIEKVAKKTSMAYLQGMAWSFAYYVHGSLPVPLTKSAEASLATLAGKGKGKGKNTAGSGQGTGVVWDW